MQWTLCNRLPARTCGACRHGLRAAPFERAADWYEAVRLLQQQPSLATVMDEYGSFALHFAAMHRASPEVVTLLLRLNEGAAKCFNKSKYLPIHYAAGNGAPPECVALIWHAYPAGAEQRNGANQTAMALATQQNRWGVPLWLCILAPVSVTSVADRPCAALFCSSENMALLKDPKRMEELAKEMLSHTIGRANQVRAHSPSSYHSATWRACVVERHWGSF